MNSLGIDPFIMQLVVVPFFVIGLGVVVAWITKRWYVGPVITLGLNLMYESWYWLRYYPDHGISYSSWNIIFPFISLLISLFAFMIRKINEVQA